jgi:polyhydroxyalkanoate synthase
MANWWSGTLAAIEKAQRATLMASWQNLELAANMFGQMAGKPSEKVVPDDRRFADDTWVENPGAEYLKESYLITSRWMEALAESLAPIDPDLHAQAQFWTNQFTDALSPSNSPFTNPVVMQEFLRTGGWSMVRGWQNLVKDAQKGRISHVPDDSFQVGVDLAITPGKVVYRNPLIELIQYTPTTEQVHAIPILVVPPWINKYYVMDMEPHNSMFKYLVDAGFTVFTISWKNPDARVLELEWDDYLELGPLTAVEVVKEITGADKVNLVGYCLGGIAAQVSLAYMAATGDDSANTATFFATHQDFNQAGDIVVFLTEPWVAFLEWLIDASGGYLDGRRMASTFNSLRANDFLWPYVVNNYLLGKEPHPFALLYWNSDTTRVPGKVHMHLIRRFFMENRLMQPDGLTVKGVGIDLGKITVPAYTVTAERDHIVPWQGTFKIRRLMGGPVRFVLTGGGHIAGIINPPSRKRKRKFWVNEGELDDPEAWLAGATVQEDSWWLDWSGWLAEHSGELIAAPAIGSPDYPPLMDAPGLYVLED